MTSKLFIAKKIANIGISLKDSKLLLDKFLFIVKEESKSAKIKLSGFGTFYTHATPERVGRNPKTMESYIIKPMYKLNFKASIKTKERLNWLKQKI